MSAGVSSLPGHMQHNPEVIAETIENNVRSTIIKTRLSDPVNYEKMSALLDDIIADRKSRAIEYEAYLKHIADLARQLVEGPSGDIPDVLKRKPALWAVYNFLQRECNPAAAETRSTGVIAESGISLLPMMKQPYSLPERLMTLFYGCAPTAGAILGHAKT